MRGLLKRIFFQALYYLQIPAVFRFLRRERITILMFHGFTDQDSSGIENYDRKHICAEKFSQILGHLASKYHVIGLEKVVAALASGGPLPRNPVVLTFDDGYESNYRIAFPELKKHNAPATIFLATDFVDRGQQLWTSRLEYAFGATSEKEFRGRIGGRELILKLNTLAERVKAVKAAKNIFKTIPQETLDEEIANVEKILKASLETATKVSTVYRNLVWPQAKEMLASGLVSFGSHTHTHKILGRCQPETIRTELAVSREIIEREIGAPCTFFCYPNGGRADISEESERILRELGFSCALTTLHGDNGRGDNPFELRRMGVPSDWDHQYFVLTLSGVLPWLGNVMARMKRIFSEPKAGKDPGGFAAQSHSTIY